MKKLLLIVVAFLGIIFSANAVQGTCVISNGGGASVNVTVVDWDNDGNINVTIGSDSSIPVNVSFKFKYQWYMEGKSNGGVYPSETSQVFAETVMPAQSNSFTYKVRMTRGNEQKMWKVIGVEVFGARCVK